MLTFREVLAALAKRGGSLGALHVAEICERDPLTATPNLDVMELRRPMLERHARYVPVMEGATLQGVVSFHDVAKAVYEEQSFENRMLKSYIGDSPDVVRPLAKTRVRLEFLRTRPGPAVRSLTGIRV